jgi:hypothetical protein
MTPAPPTALISCDFKYQCQPGTKINPRVYDTCGHLLSIKIAAFISITPKQRKYENHVPADNAL